MSQAFPSFVTDAPDSNVALPAQADPTLADIIGAHWTLGRQDQAGVPEQAITDAYSTVANELDKALPDDRSSFQRWTSDRYALPVTGGIPFQTDRVWQDVARARAADPNFLKDLPATDDASFQKWVQEGQLSKRRAAQAVVARQSGVVQGLAGFATDIGTGFTDPINLGSMALTGPIGGAAKTLPQIMAREALVNAATEAVQQPIVAGNRAAFGEDTTALDMAKDIGTAAVGGAVFGGGIHLAPRVGDAIGAGVDRVLPGYRAARALDQAQVAPASDAEVLAHYEGRVPPEQRTPEQAAAVSVLQRQTESAAVNPFVSNPAGLQTHADAINQHIDTIETALSSMTGATRRQPPDSPPAAPLDRDGIISFVMNGLEGGPAVVPYSAADGGTTKFGIAAKDNPGVDVANLTEDQAAEIARKKYWFPELDHADPRVAAVAFDAGFISGPGFGRHLLSEAGDDVDRALQLYRDHLDHIADTVPGKAKYKQGWSNRVDKLARRIGGMGDDLPFLDPAHFEDADGWRDAQDALDSEALENEGQSAPDPASSVSSTIGHDEVLAASTDAEGTDMGRAGDFLRAHADQALDAGLPVTLHIGDRDIPIVSHGLVDSEGQAWGAMPFLSPAPGENPRLEIGGEPRPIAPDIGEPATETAFDKADAPAAIAQAQSLEHDVHMDIAEHAQPEAEGAAPEKMPTFRLDDEGPEVGAGDILAAHDEDLAAVERARACLAPPGVAE